LRKKIGNLWFYPYFMQEIVARRIDRVITGSRASLESVRNAFSLRPGAITAIYDGVDTEVFHPRGMPRRAGSLLYVGNSDDRNKGARYLVEAAALLRDRGVTFDVTFVGARDAKLVPQMVAELGLASRVTLTGRLTLAELARAYGEAQIMVSPSLYEGFGLPAAEASACGTPVVAAAGGALPEVIADGETGVIVPPANARALADAIESLLADPARCGALGAAGAKRMAEHFSWRHCAEATVDLYAEVLDRRRAASAARA
jgi:glycosyltransferase involved in cell wall biosynthesis